jgi:predicted DNA-binding transcriptional regulator AlpA
MPLAMTAPSPATPPACWTIRQLAQWLGISERHLHRLRERPDFPKPVAGLGRSVRFADDDVEQFLARRRPR